MLSTKRLRKENLSLQSEPVPLAIARPLEANILEWRFLIKGSDDYDGGFYHGKLIFPPQYPMKPPGIMFFTPSGRFETNKRVCLTISDFHPETWSPLWTVGSILTGIVSFMNSDEITTGGLASSSKDRKAYALSSAAYNAKDHVYTEVFGSDPPNQIFEESNIKIEENMKKRLELRDLQQQRATEANRTTPSRNGTSSTPITARAAFTNTPSASSKSSTDSPSVALLPSTPLTKSAKKRMKDREKALKLKENGGVHTEGEEIPLSPSLSHDGSDNDDDVDEKEDARKGEENIVQDFSNLKIAGEKI